MLEEYNVIRKCDLQKNIFFEFFLAEGKQKSPQVFGTRKEYLQNASL